MLDILKINSVDVMDKIIVGLLIFFFCFLIYCVLRINNENTKLKKKIKELEKDNKDLRRDNKDLKDKYDRINKLSNNIYVKRENVKASPYQKNVFKGVISTTSPVGMGSKVNVDDLIKKDNTILKDIKPIEGISKNIKTASYVKDVSRRLKDATDNTPIELTDYEQRQEDMAIISCKELLSNKNNINIVDDEADLDFIDDLKKFRKDLNDKEK